MLQPTTRGEAGLPAKCDAVPMKKSSVSIRLLASSDVDVLADVAPDVFDDAVNPDFVAEFLADERHHLAVALDEGRVVGIASAVHYIHPDKPNELWINEVGVAPTHLRRGIGRALVHALLEKGRTLRCVEAWVLTDEENTSARKLYRSAGGEEKGRPVYVTFDLRR